MLLQKNWLEVGLDALLSYSCAGVYRCYITAQESKRIVATVGQSVDLTCETPSGQQAVWYRNERPLNNGSTRVITRDTLTIMDTNLRDSGRYTCIDPAQTPTSLFSRDFSLVLLRKSIILELG